MSLAYFNNKYVFGLIGELVLVQIKQSVVQLKCLMDDFKVSFDSVHIDIFSITSFISREKTTPWDIMSPECGLMSISLSVYPIYDFTICKSKLYVI